MLTSFGILVDDVVVRIGEKHKMIDESGRDLLREHVFHSVSPSRAIHGAQNALERKVTAADPRRELFDLHLTQWHVRLKTQIKLNLSKIITYLKSYNFSYRVENLNY